VPLFENFTRHAVAERAGSDHEGREAYTIVLKATFVLDSRGALGEASSTQPVTLAPVFTGPPATSGLALDTDLVPSKKRVDVVLAGAIKVPVPVEEVDVTLEVGTRIRKVVRVIGDRSWLPGLVSALSPSAPKPWTAMPIAWDRSFGGSDLSDSAHVERRNPVGRGMQRKAAAAQGLPLPNFEDPRRLVRSWSDRVVPVGFGPVAPHWEPRVKRAGTFDAFWEAQRKPALPADFDPWFFNSAPDDQQLDGYLPGEEVRLDYMTERVHERFRLPELRVPAYFAVGGRVDERPLVPDTVIIEPAARRISVVARATVVPDPDLTALRGVVVGSAPPGRLKALRTERRYL
jgi:hypothetical protein